METLAKFVLSAIELAEAELRSLQHGITKLGLKLAAVFVAGFLGLIGTVLMLTAVFLLLERLLGDIAAFAIIGVTFAGVAAGLVMWALHKPASPRSELSGPPDAFGVGTDPQNPATGGGTDEAPIRIAS
ncbi:MAG: phage holin family protein [Tepidisphaeraceae bacterium]